MKKAISLLLAGCLTLSLAACGSGTSTPPAPSDSATPSAPTEDRTPKVGGSINVGLNSAPVSENIWCQNDLNSATIMNLVCPNLVTMDENGVKYNYLAESSTSNEDCTEWTITLKDLVWNDGVPLPPLTFSSPPSTV